MVLKNPTFTLASMQMFIIQKYIVKIFNQKKYQHVVCGPALSVSLNH